MSFARAFGWVALVAALGSPVSAAAQAKQGQQVWTGWLDATPDSLLQASIEKIEGTPLTLEEAIRAALDGAGSTAARDAAAMLAAARGSARRERGAFDPELFAQGLKTDVNQKNASPFEQKDAIETKRTVGTGGLRMLLPIGTELEASLDGARTETDATFTTVNPQYDAVTRLSLRQPLLRGFGPGTGSEATATSREAEAALARYDDVILGVRALVEQVYWDLYAAERDLAVQRLIFERATSLVEQAEVRARSGLVGPSDVANAKVFRSEQEQNLLDREESLDRISDELATLIGRRPAGAPRFHATNTPPAEFPIEPEDSVVVRAEQENRELRAQERELSAARARVQGAAWNRLPALDFVGSIGGTGLAGTGRDFPFAGDTLRSNISGNFGDAWDQASGRDFPTWSAGIQLSFPLLLRSGRGEYDRLRGEAERVAQGYEETRRRLDDNVREAHRALVRASRRLEAARSGADAAREQVRIGVLRYNSGQTTAFELVRLGSDFATAQQRYSQALVRTAKAAAALRFLTSGAYPASTIDEGGTKP